MTGAARGAGVERSRSRKRTALRIAAAVVPALIAAATILYLLNQRLSEHFDVTVLSDVTESTERGTQKHIILPDGSQAWINSGSSIGYATILIKRTVYSTERRIIEGLVQQPFTENGKHDRGDGSPINVGPTVTAWLRDRVAEGSEPSAAGKPIAWQTIRTSD
ncbi:MAG: hypothetical protein ACLUEV_09820 [Alistipes sp.]